MNRLIVSKHEDTAWTLPDEAGGSGADAEGPSLRPHLYVLKLGMRGLVGIDLDIQEDNEGVIRVTTGDSRKGH